MKRVGGTKTIQVDVRVIAATNKDLEKEIARGSFREDLYYRLNVIPIHVPPLKERKEDIPILVQDFLEEFSRKDNTESKTISQKALEALTAHDWPGNVRELKNYVERLVIMSPGAVIESVELMPSPALPSSRPASFPDILAVPTLREAKALAEREYIQSRLAEYKGNVTQTAEAIGLDRTSLHKKIKALGLKTEAG